MNYVRSLVFDVSTYEILCYGLCKYCITTVLMSSQNSRSLIIELGVMVTTVVEQWCAAVLSYGNSVAMAIGLPCCQYALKCVTMICFTMVMFYAVLVDSRSTDT